MATSAFKSTTRRTSVGGDDSAAASSTSRLHRRSRSLSRFSRPLPPEEELTAADHDRTTPARRGKFVNTVRGSGFPEISLDDLALEFFSQMDEPQESGDRGRSARRGSEVGRWAEETASSRRRGRSVSRQSSGASGDVKTFVSAGPGHDKCGALDAKWRRRRSVSAVRRRDDSENDFEHSRAYPSQTDTKGPVGRNSAITSLQKETALGDRQFMRCRSHKDLSTLDGYTSQSSGITDEELRDTPPGHGGVEKTIRAVYSQKKAEHPAEDILDTGLYETMRKELRHAVEEIKTEIEQAMGRKHMGDGLEFDNSDRHQGFSAIWKNTSTKLDESEKLKQDLLAEFVLEEQRGREISKVMSELIPNSNKSTTRQKQLRTRKRSNDRNRLTQRLTEEAEKYLEDFVLNVEDTDISSYDGERSDASSSMGGNMKPKEGAAYEEVDNYRSPAGSTSHPAEMDGVILPWLQWETSNDSSIPGKCRGTSPVTPKAFVWNAEQDPGKYSASSHGSWSPGLLTGPLLKQARARENLAPEFRNCEKLPFDMDEYLKLKRDEDHMFEMYRERHRIRSGSFLLCRQII